MKKLVFLVVLTWLNYVETRNFPVSSPPPMVNNVCPSPSTTTTTTPPPPSPKNNLQPPSLGTIFPLLFPLSSPTNTISPNSPRTSWHPCHYTIISPSKPSKKEANEFQINLMFLALFLTTIFNVIIIWWYDANRDLITRDTLNMCALVLAIVVCWAPCLLLGPQNIYIASVMVGFGFFGTFSAAYKLYNEMVRADALIFYRKRGNGDQKIIFLNPKHVLDVLLPFSYLKYAITVVFEVVTYDGFDYRIKLCFRTWFVVVASTTAMVNFIRERRRFMREREGENEEMVELSISHNVPCQCSCVIVHDITENDTLTQINDSQTTQPNAASDFTDGNENASDPPDQNVDTIAEDKIRSSFGSSSNGGGDDVEEVENDNIV